MFAITLSDGSVQFRYRASLDVVLPDENPDEVQSLPQSGLVFPAVEPCLHTALSPGACVLATLMDEDGKEEVKIERMGYMNGKVEEIGVDERESSPYLGFLLATLSLRTHLSDS